MSLHAIFASERIMGLKLSQLRSFFSDNSDRLRGVEKSITVLFSATRPRCRRVDAEQMSISRRSPKLTSISSMMMAPRATNLYPRL